jgi:ketosteroid isomerase-like protein
MLLMPLEVALNFVDRINRGDVDGLAGLMTDDHRFIDSMGAEIRGRETMRLGWVEYLRMVPDYRIDVLQTLVEEDVIVLLGTAGGTCSRTGGPPTHGAWQTPAAWRALIRDGLVAEWQVYADNEPIRRQLSGGFAPVGGPGSAL